MRQSLSNDTPIGVPLHFSLTSCDSISPFRFTALVINLALTRKIQELYKLYKEQKEKFFACYILCKMKDLFTIWETGKRKEGQTLVTCHLEVLLVDRVISSLI